MKLWKKLWLLFAVIWVIVAALNVGSILAFGDEVEPQKALGTRTPKSAGHSAFCGSTSSRSTAWAGCGNALPRTDSDQIGVRPRFFLVLESWGLTPIF